MMDDLKRLLEYLSERVDPEQQEKADALHQAALEFREVHRLPVVMEYDLPPDAPFRPFPHREIFDDPEKMLFNELVYAFRKSIACGGAAGDDLPFTIRANFGTVLIASLLGGRVEQVEDNPPWALAFSDLDGFRTILDRDPTDFSRGLCPKVMERYEFYAAALADYPLLQQGLKIVLPDLQGPLDTVELLRGSEVYVDMVAEPEMFARAMEIAARAQVAFAKRLLPLTTDGPAGFSHQHAVTVRGNILIRNDSAINISPAMYRDAVARHDEYVLQEMGGGGIHSCGRIEHSLDELFVLPSLRCFDFGQPEMNDADAAYARARERKIALLRLRVGEDDLTTGGVMERFVTGVTLVHDAGTVENARRIMEAYRKATRE